MAKEKNNNVILLVSTSVGLILMLALISALAVQVDLKTTTASVVNETISIASARNSSGQLNTSKVFYPTYYATGWQKTDGDSSCLPGNNGFVLLNSTGATMTNGTNYAVASDGSFTLLSVAPLNGTATSNTTYVSYNYCPSDYVNSSWGRTLLNLVIGMLCIAILIVGVIAAYKLLGGSED